MSLVVDRKDYENSLIRVNFLSSIAIIVFIIATLTTIQYITGKTQLQEKIERDQEIYIKHKKTQNREIISSVIDIIDSAVNRNILLPEKELQEYVLELLRPIRFGHDDSGYIFSMVLLKPEGGKNFAYENLVPVAPELENKYISDDKIDAKGREYRKEYLRQLRETGEADVVYTYKKSDSEFNIDKAAYMKLYKKWNWIIGTGTYLDELEAIKAKNEKAFDEEFKKEFVSTFGTIIFFGLISVFITILFNTKIRKVLDRYEDDLKDNQKILEQYKEAVDQSTIFSKTDVDGNITYVNDKFCEISKYSKEELVGNKHNILRDPETPDNTFKEMWETISSNKVWEGQLTNINKDGKRFYVNAIMYPIANREGEILEFISIKNDITELEEYKDMLESQLDLSNNKLVESFQLIREYEKAIDKATAFIRTDLEWNINSVNNTFCDLVGVDKETIVYKDFKTFFSNELGEDCNFDVSILKDVPAITKKTLFKHNDKEFHFHSIFVPILDLEGEILEIMSIHHNITEIINLTEEIEDTQKEVVFTMGAIGESRSKETGNHVKRVAEYSYLFAKLLGMKEEECELIKMASPMHDIGKVAIPDAILNKPGRFTEEEYVKMQQHSELGYNMLKHSNREIMKTAATIAYEHHEKYNGKGYPRKIKGEDIHIYGRITAIADVFDALGSDRVYKEKWDDEKIFNLFKEERGEQFDPKLIDLFFKHKEKFLKIREDYKDLV